VALTANEKVYITERYMPWTYGKMRYWEHLPVASLDEPATAGYAEVSKNKPALVLLHGYGGMAEHWRRVIAGLKNRYRLYALDLAGFGYTTKPTNQQASYSPQLWVQQVAEFIQTRQEHKVILVGHSLGGLVSLLVQIDYPQLVAGLALLSPGGLPKANELQNSDGWGKLAGNAIKLPGLGEAFAAVFSLPKEWAARKFLEGMYYNLAKITPQLVEQFAEPLRQSGAAASYLAVSRASAKFVPDFRPGQVTCPTLLVWGEYDKIMPPDSFVPAWRNLLPQAEIYRVADTGHCPMDERPDLFNPRLIQFVEQVAANVNS
jgi:pimeloyl-ACP methyl ester carboxylesterase